ncbi:MAG: hypothetical protein O7D34_00440 [Ignavibacteria bacterium]|nr:hypothetical protein [Ignavibacteria bacterium]
MTNSIVGVTMSVSLCVFVCGCSLIGYEMGSSGRYVKKERIAVHVDSGYTFSKWGNTTHQLTFAKLKVGNQIEIILKNGDTLAGEYVNRVTTDSGRDSAITINDSIMETILLADTKVVNAVKSKDSKWLGLGIGAVIDVAIFLVLFTLANIPH